MLELAKYDGSAGFLVDTNIWIDCMDPGSRWHEWSVNQLQICGEQAPPAHQPGDLHRAAGPRPRHRGVGRNA